MRCCRIGVLANYLRISKRGLLVAFVSTSDHTQSITYKAGSLNDILVQTVLGVVAASVSQMSMNATLSQARVKKNIPNQKR